MVGTKTRFRLKLSPVKGPRLCDIPCDRCERVEETGDRQAEVEAEAEAGYGIESILRLTSRQSGREF